VSAVLATGVVAVLGPIARLIRGVWRAFSLFVVIFICVFIISIFIRPPALAPLFIAETDGQLATLLITEHPPLAMKDTDASGILLIVELINRGNMQSVARKFALEAIIDDRDTYIGKFEPIPQTVTTTVKDGYAMTLFGGDALYNKALVPVHPGGSVTGLLLFSFGDIPRETFEHHKTTFILSFQRCVG